VGHRFGTRSTRVRLVSVAQWRYGCADREDSRVRAFRGLDARSVDNFSPTDAIAADRVSPICDHPAADKEPSSMKRIASRALIAALAASLALSGAVAAKDHTSHGKAAVHGGAAGHSEKAGAALVAGLKTKGNASHPGGVFRVLAIVKAAPADRPATVDAIVHFASGDVVVVLTRHGSSKGAAYHANVPVPAAEPAGIVLIDATAVVAGATLTATGSGKIVVGGDEAEAPESAAAESPAAESPEACTSPAPNEAPEASKAPEASGAPTASQSPDASESPEASASPAVESPVTSASPDAGASPIADQVAANCDEGDAEGRQLSADAIARLVAFNESLFA
jgi:hypothetical protein